MPSTSDLSRSTKLPGTFCFAKIHGYITKYKYVSKRDHLVKNCSQVSGTVNHDLQGRSSQCATPWRCQRKYSPQKNLPSHVLSCLTYFNFILNICNIKINRSRRYLPNPTYVRLKRDVTRVIRFLAPTFRRLLFKLNSSCLRFPSCRFCSLDGMANLFFCGISQVNITIDRHYDYQLHLPHESWLFCPRLKMGMV